MNPVTNGSKFWVQLRQAAVIVNGGIMIFAGVNLYRGNDKFYEEIAMPMFRMFGAETAHNLGIKLAKYKIVPKPQKPDSPLLKTEVWGRSFPNPIGLAAGYDKQGEAVDGLLKIGFGFVEVGSVTPAPQPGNPTPRVFRLKEDKAVINRYGFNSDGHEVVFERLSRRNQEQAGEKAGVLGVNLGKNKTSPDAVSDYVKGVRKFGGIADYLVINVSSPNTPGLRDMQKQEVLIELLDQVVAERNKLTVSPKPPLLVKIAPDLTESDKKDIAAVVTRPQSGVDGLIISNTTVARPESLKSKHKAEMGGLSGAPLTEKSLQVIRDMYRLTHGKIPIVGVGGVSCGQDAYDKVKAGASLIQMYTALVYLGPPAVGKIKREMEELLRKDGYKHISEAVGADFKARSEVKS
ncbi:dihydroorotate dehydrogenase (quinone), mitochondrial isoform X2 [Aplysia californica]|uniref:Dihydroorotate dehydrogenase (quinone), mitochondrial n=1 Tax=Aplysia californica TaxID=6500 RepID=A0ABM0ZVE8_APLCA|nr:dihydroorotate dehydrogenase (quinone), mitochondrial isoform X2 [Aplysia californica]